MSSTSSTSSSSARTWFTASEGYGHHPSHEDTARRRGALVIRWSDDNHRNRYHTNLKTLQMRNHSRTDAITELEAIYGVLEERLKDQDLLDRAERRDLPFSHQLFWTNDCNNNDIGVELTNGETKSVDTTDGIDYESFDKRRSMATIEALEALRSDDYKCNTTEGWLRGGHRWAIRSRTPPTRRSAIPDIVRDDFAFRKYNRSQSQSQLCPNDAHLSGYNSIKRINNNKHYSMSYLMVSSASEDSLYYDGNRSDSGVYANDADLKYLSKADIKVDDLSNRWIRQASANTGVQPPHPPFGIPNTIVSHSTPNAYIRAEMDPKEMSKVRFRCKSSVPHLVHDDMAYRSLRKDSKGTPITPTTRPPPPLGSPSLNHSLPNLSRLPAPRALKSSLV